MNIKIKSLIKDEENIKDQQLEQVIESNSNNEKFKRFRRFKKEKPKIELGTKNVYYNFINLDEIISSINNTKYHSNDNLNSLFQIRAINYIINDNSSFAIFIHKLFLLYNKAYIEKNENDKFLEIINNEGGFTVIIKKGKTFTKDDFNNLKKKVEEKNKKIMNEKSIKKDKCVEKELKHNQKVQYKLCKYDTDVIYDYTFIPFKPVYYLNGKEMKHQERNEVDRGVARQKDNYNNFINVYDLMFSVKNVDNNNIIVLEKNDINEILEHYSNEETFYSLLNQNFSYKTQDEENIYITQIKAYLKNKKLIG